MPEPIMRIATDESRPSLKAHTGFTVAILGQAVCPAGKDRVQFYDAKTPGLALRVTRNGSKSFVYYRKVSGSTKRIKLGGFPDISIEQARKLATQASGKIADGIDPMEERRAIRNSITLQELFDRYTAEHAMGRCTPATLVTDKSRFKVCFDDWKARRLATLHPHEVKTKHNALAAKRGQTNANRAMQLLRRMFKWARLENPVTEVDFFTEQERERFLQPDELPRFFTALAQEPNPTIRDFIYLSLYTGARRSNVQSMRWDEISFDSSNWTIPADKSKSGKPMHAHLPEPAIDILNVRKDNGSEWIFPGASKTGHLQEPRFAWNRLLKRAKITDLHIHDLRRSLGSWMAAGGASLPLIGKQLGHQDVATTAIYSRLNIDPTRQFVDTAVNAMLATVAQAKVAAKKASRKKRGKATKAR